MKNVSGSILLIAAVLLAVGCSREEQEEVAERFSTAGKALRGEVRAGNANAPRIVRDQQRKERIRQESEWTPENQALHPIEYCQAQLEKLAENANRLDVQAHKYAVAKNQAQRTISESESQLEGVAQFLEEAKRAYRDADATGRWPVTIRGFALSKEKAQEKIVAAAEKRPMLKNAIAKNKALIVSLEKKSARVIEEQKNIIKTKERIQIVLNDLNLKKIVEGDEGITDALNAINDSLGSLGTDYDDPSVEDLLGPEKSSAIKVSFDAIMAE